ncbi:MAG: hypothetical protein HY331_01430 [Chloroflexi bacterium]|nr:hypothetical protein [Chloroflexota bacterium]
MQTTAPGVFVAGDCAGFHDGMIANSDIARDQGRLAGIAAAESLGAVASGRAGTLRAQLQHLNGAGSSGVHTHWATWLHSIVDVSGYEAHTCQCEEVTRREVADVQPPRYLHWSSQEMSARSLKTLAKDGPINQDQIKRLTRAGMGHCQGRRCREQIALLLADEAGTDVSQIPMPSYRAPVRPLPLYVMWPDDEPEEMRENWTGWFGIRSAMRGRMAGLGGLLSTRVGGIPKPVPAKQGSGSTPAGQQ